MIDNQTTTSPHIIAIANQKGGVGKTTTALNLGTALAQSGLRVLIVDLDPQGNASTGLDIPRSDRQPGCYNSITGRAELDECIRATQVEGLFIIPAEPDLAGAEIELVDQPNREFCLQRALSHVQGFPVIIIDCPPSLGLLTLNGLVAATTVLVPLQCEFFALEGLSQLAQTVDRVRGSFNQRAVIEGIVLTMYDRRNNLSELVAADARSFFGQRVYETVIPRSVRVSEAPSHGKPVMLYDPRSAGALAYGKMAQELSDRFHLRTTARADA
ncbi:ParA family protein [Acidisphaera sp. L21]|uniref:ParA family protein n=1 Tax=Acidisphaera sp. L21 TaxID=1641851 RepID=UPI00131B6D99|nr:ParA family protein [Acidisphaera sp. L21]